MPKIPGCTVYMWSTSARVMSHVGMYVGNGKVVEARGVLYGVVETNLADRAWGYWGLLNWLDYDLPADNGTLPGPNAAPNGSDSAGQMPDDKPCDGVPSLEGLGDTGYSVKLLQQWLNLHGANPKLAEDGIFGPKTEAAVIAFKGSGSLPEDGIACIETWTKLIVPPPAVPLTLSTIHLNDTGVLVTLLQRLLYTYGITPWAIDGQFSATTLTAVKEFQQTRRLLVDGIVGPQTWGALVNPASALPRTVKMGDTGSEVEEMQAHALQPGLHARRAGRPVCGIHRRGGEGVPDEQGAHGRRDRGAEDVDGAADAVTCSRSSPRRSRGLALLAAINS